MELWLNFGLAWVSVLLVFLLSVIYILRMMVRSKCSMCKSLDKINKFLRKHHKIMGILLVITGLIHGLFSSEKVWSLNIGTMSWVVSILLGINWMVRKSLGKYKGWMYYHRLLTAIFVGTIVWHVIDVGGIQAHKILFRHNTEFNSSISLPSSSSSSLDDYEVSDINSQIQGGKYKDGTFTGEATGYRAGLKVSIKIKNNQLISVEVTEHNEVNQRFYSRPIQIVPQEIIDEQSTQVDTVSGATFTSIGIINAVNDALSKAIVSGEVPKNLELPKNSGKGGRH